MAQAGGDSAAGHAVGSLNQNDGWNCRIEHRRVAADEPYAGTDQRVTLERGGRLEERVVDFVYQPIRDAGGAVTGVLVQGIDTTDRKRAEEAARERDERLQLLLGHATDYAVIISDPGDRVLEWLGGAEAITGWRAAEVLGQPVALIFTPEDRAAGAPDQETGKAAETGRAENVRWHQRKDGTRFFAEGVTVSLRGPAGELRGFGKVFRDATARKLAILFYQTMRQGLAYVERGLEAYEQAYRERQQRYLQKRAAELGFTLAPLLAPTP